MCEYWTAYVCVCVCECWTAYVCVSAGQLMCV